jgi:hypothetical protein
MVNVVSHNVEPLGGVLNRLSRMYPDQALTIMLTTGDELTVEGELNSHLDTLEFSDGGGTRHVVRIDHVVRLTYRAKAAPE